MALNLFWAMPHDLPDRNSLPWIEPMAHAPAMEMQGPNH